MIRVFLEPEHRRHHLHIAEPRGNETKCFDLAPKIKDVIVSGSVLELDLIKIPQSNIWGFGCPRARLHRQSLAKVERRHGALNSRYNYRSAKRALSQQDSSSP